MTTTEVTAKVVTTQEKAQREFIVKIGDFVAKMKIRQIKTDFRRRLEELKYKVHQGRVDGWDQGAIASGPLKIWKENREEGGTGAGLGRG